MISRNNRAKELSIIRISTRTLIFLSQTGHIENRWGHCRELTFSQAQTIWGCLPLGAEAG
jgi:hypothetical protein